ncbi:GNAT family N-acetyltransferase [Pseudooctadecabacter jejudonensis]|uniref:Acetyltransferase (GNAT) family protein n=1 Tax=Pseudooctadecabacter jejudonensis TaxID=1391910 RepID=A0A1Y5SV27_9RHOB|nr:GNAT family N-acetyltransferase [Pseudooctadecabacter jejudonensis]SLN49213.1 Acetyltransferase (GNAT) family protein [Pseudooctadecabacter jejudonensis]
MIVRPLEQADWSAWDALYAGYADFYQVDQTPQMRALVWEWIMDPAHEVDGLVAADGDTLIGFAHIRPFARPLAAQTGLFLDDLFVSPAARGSGAAQTLIEAVRVRAAADGHGTVRWITAHDNARARKVYDTLAAPIPFTTYDMDV